MLTSARITPLALLLTGLTLAAQSPLPARAPSRETLDGLWSTLAGDDAVQAYRAICTLVAAPEVSVPFMKEHLHPAPPPDASRISQLLRDLDHQRFAVRDRATRELDKLGEQARPGLRKLLEGTSSAEVRRRVEQLLASLDGPVTKPELLRGIRAIEALERIGTVDARQLLKTLANGAPEIRLTQEAKASLDRLLKRQS